MPGRNGARIVKVTITSEGEVKRTRDDRLSRPWVNAIFPKNGTTYGWNIEPHINSGKIRRPVLVSDAPVAPNASGRDDHQHTLQTQGSHFVKLDCGFWGNYDTSLPANGRQRNFGIVEGDNVWLCNYEGTGAADNSGGILPSAGTLADKLLQTLDTHGLHITLVSHATIPTVKDATIAPNKIYICFPDVHLPEQWPDLYPVAKRAGAGYRRAALRWLLLESQRRPGPRNDGLLTQKNLDKVQEALDAWEAGGTSPLDIEFTVSTSTEFVPGSEMPVLFQNTYKPSPPWTKDEVLAEKAHLDREIQGRSAWFYPVKDTPNAYAGVSSPFEGEDNPPTDCTADDPVSADAAPAADLANFLFVLKEFRKNGPDGITIIQVGDLYELWMNREFMYKDAPTIPADEIGKIKWGGVTVAVETVVPLNSTQFSYREAFQLRQDPTWVERGVPHPAKHYVFHDWPRAEQYFRHNTAGAIPGAAAGRLVAELKRRITSVEAWSHRDSRADRQSLADHADLIPPLRAWIGSQPAKFFARSNRRGETEICWHRLILQLLLEELRAKVIHGNHDGYRSDRQLLPKPEGTVTPAPDMPPGQRRMGSTEWFSDAGLWVEHGHRWDYYNRDGVAMGAGMTNIVYYHNHELIAQSKGKMAQVQKQEQAFFQPGAAQWFLLVNYGERKKWYGNDVLPFGVFVSGHTHSPDLVKIYYELSNIDAATEAVEEAASTAKKKVVDAAHAAKQKASDAAQSIRSAASAAVDKVKSYLP